MAGIDVDEIRPAVSEGHGRKHTSEGRNADIAGEKVRKNAGAETVNPDGQVDREWRVKNEKKQIQRVKNRRLHGPNKRLPGKIVGIPQRDLAANEAIEGKATPIEELAPCIPLDAAQNPQITLYQDW